MSRLIDADLLNEQLSTLLSNYLMMKNFQADCAVRECIFAAKHTPTVDAVTIGIAREYMWHYLDGNGERPDPESNNSVIVAHYLWFDTNTGDNEIDYDFISFAPSSQEWKYIDATGIPAVNWDFVIAWKYIEPLER